MSVWGSGARGSLQPNDEKGNGMRSSLSRKENQKSSPMCQDAVRLGWGRWFSPKGMELLAACLFPSSSSEAPWSQDAAFNDSVVCLAVADLTFLERININTFFCLSFIFFSPLPIVLPPISLSAVYQRLRKLWLVITGAWCCPACNKIAQCER